MAALLKSTELLLEALRSGDEAQMDAALRRREQAVTELRAAEKLDRPTQEARDLLAALEEQLLAEATRARDLVSAELREVRDLRRSTGRMRGQADARFIDSRV